MDPLIDGGWAGGGGLIGALLAFLGLGRRIDHLEKKVDELPQGYIALQTHTTCQGATVASLNRVHRRLDVMEKDNKTQTNLLHEIKGSLEGKDG